MNARGRPPIVALLLVPSAVVVALALVLLRLHYQPPVIPEYTLATTPNVDGLRPTDRLELLLRPTTPVTGAVAVRGFVVRGDDVKAWDPPFSVTPDGTVRIEGVVGTLFEGVSPGVWQIALAVGRPEVLPTLPSEILRAKAYPSAPAGWRLLRQPVKLDR